MSGTLPSLDIQEQVVRIDRAIAEAHKFQAEQTKLVAEAQKYARERVLAPILASGVLGGAIAALIPLILHALGGR